VLTITHLSYTPKNSHIDPDPPYSVPYLIVNCTFKMESDEGGYKGIAIQDSQDVYRDRCVADSPEDLWNCKWREVYSYKEIFWKYLEKFDTFWFRDCVADCPITRACLKELEFYKEHRLLPTVYRHSPYGVVLRHLRTLSSYWD
jgi:hypothetical protein